MDTDGTWWLDCEPIEADYDREYWTTKDGRRLKIELMETSHIKNTINLLKRNINKLEDYEKEYYEDYFEFNDTNYSYTAIDTLDKNIYQECMIIDNNECVMYVELEKPYIKKRGVKK